MLTLYERNTGGRMKGMMIAVSGGILASGMGLGTLVLSIFGAVGHMSSLVTSGTCFMAVGALTGVGLLAVGIKNWVNWNVFKSILTHWEITHTVILNNCQQQ